MYYRDHFRVKHVLSHKVGFKIRLYIFGFGFPRSFTPAVKMIKRNIFRPLSIIHANNETGRASSLEQISRFPAADTP